MDDSKLGKHKPLVSIIIPTFRRDEKMLKRAILSSVNQTYNNLEIIIVNDNDEKNYSIQIKELLNELNDSRIILIENEKNFGGVVSRNRGIKYAKGVYVSFLDDDDFYLSNKIASQVSYINATNHDFVISNLAIVDEKYKLKDLRNFKWFKGPYNNNDLIIEHYKYHLTGTPTFLFKRNLLKIVGGFPEANIGHEFFLVNNALKAGFSLGYLNKTLSVAVQHKGERISNNNNRQEDLDSLLNFKINSIKNISIKDKRRIFHRHYLAKAFTYINTKKLNKAMLSLLLALYYGPKAFWEEAMKRLLIKVKSDYFINENM